MPDRYGLCVIPIHRQLGGARLESFGSGVCLRIVDFRIIVSAAHVLNDGPLWLPGKPKFVPLDEAGRVFTTSPNLASAHADTKDVGYVVLHSRAADALVGQGFSFLSVAHTSFGKELGNPDHLIFSGYPWRKSENHRPGQISNARMDVAENAIPVEELPALGCVPRLHVAMRYDRKEVQHEGRRVTGALPHGMSGGAVWHIAKDGTSTLVAIATDYDAKNKLLRGTVIDPVLSRIRDHLREILEKRSNI